MWHISNGYWNRYHQILIETTELGFNFQLIFDVNQATGIGILARHCRWHFDQAFVSLFSLFTYATSLLLQQSMNFSFDRLSGRFAMIINDFVQREFDLFNMHLTVICDNDLKHKIKNGKHENVKKKLAQIALKSDFHIVFDLDSITCTGILSP